MVRESASSRFGMEEDCNLPFCCDIFASDDEMHPSGIWHSRNGKVEPLPVDRRLLRDAWRASDVGMYVPFAGKDDHIHQNDNRVRQQVGWDQIFLGF